MIKEIITGWYHYTEEKLGVVDEDLKKESLRKLEFCKVCEFNNGTTCKKCGCHLISKSYSDSKCPIGNF